MLKERQLEKSLIKQLKVLIYIFRPDIVDRRTHEQNFKTKFEALNRVRLSDNEFLRLREEIIEPDLLKASNLLLERQYFHLNTTTPPKITDLFLLKIGHIHQRKKALLVIVDNNSLSINETENLIVVT